MNSEFMQHCLAFSITEDTPNKLVFKFNKCLWAKTFLELKEPGLGYAMCCYSVYEMTKAFHPKLKLTRNKTLMQGNTCCEAIYTWEE